LYIDQSLPLPSLISADFSHFSAMSCLNPGCFYHNYHFVSLLGGPCVGGDPVSPFNRIYGWTGQHVDEQLNEAEDEEVLSESDTDSEDETSRTAVVLSSEDKLGVAAVETTSSPRDLAFDSASKCSGLLTISQQIICFENGYKTITPPEGNW